MAGKKISKKTLRPPKRKKKVRPSGPSGTVFHRKSNSSPTLDCLYKSVKLHRRKKYSSRNSTDSTKSIDLESLEERNDVFCGITSTDKNWAFAVSNTSIEDLLASNSRKSQNQLGEFPSGPLPEQRRQLLQILSNYFDATSLEADEVKERTNFLHDVDLKSKVLLRKSDLFRGSHVETSPKHKLESLVRHVTKMEDKLADERRKIGELKTVIGYSSSSSNCHFENRNRFCHVAPPHNFNMNYDLENLSETENCDSKIKEETFPFPCAKKEEMTNFLCEFNDYVNEMSRKEVDVDAKHRRDFNEGKVTGENCPKFNNAFQKEDSNVSLKNENEKIKENSMNTEDVWAIKKLLSLLIAGVKFNRKKSSIIQNSSTHQDRIKPKKVNVLANLLSKIKGKPKNQRSGQNLSNTSSSAQFNSLNSIHKIGNIESAFKIFRNDKRRSSKSADDTTQPQHKTWKKHVEELRHLINHNQKLAEGKQSLAERDLERHLEDVKCELKEKNEILENAKTQFSEQLTALSHELGMAEDVLTLSLNAAEILLEDMLKIKEKLTPLIPDVKWNVYEAPKNSLSHLIKISRSFINDLADHLITVTKELATTRREKESYKEESAKLSELAEESRSKIKSLSEQAKDVEALKAREDDQIKIIERQKLEAKEKEELLKEIADDVKELKEEVLGKDVQLESLKFEAQTLREHVAGLSQIILASGTGDAIRELTGAKDQLSALQATYEQVLRERNSVVEKLDQYELEKSEFEKNRDGINRALKEQSGELEKLQSKNLEMTEQLATQQSTLAALQNERVRHLEEKNFLNITFGKLQEEFGRIEQLEGNLLNTNKEANRLAVIAEYNKQLGEVLQHEVSERDAVILELQKDVKTLNEMQRENVQDKMALCRELTEACSMKDVLHSKLDEQIKKSAHLTEAQRTVESKTSKDLRAAKEMQDKERDAIKQITADFGALVCQRGELLEKPALKIENLRAKNRKLRGKIAKANRFIYEKISVIMQLERDVSEKEKEIQRLNLDLQGQSARHAKEIGKLKSEGNRLSKERKSLVESTQFLKKNAEELQSDLNKKQEESEDLLQLKTKELERLEILYGEKNLEMQRIREERDQLGFRLDDFVQQQGKERVEFEERVKNLERDAKDEMDLLKQELESKAEKLAVLEENYETTDKLYDHLSKDFEDVAVENRELKNIKLELIAERETLIMSNDLLKEEMRILSDKLELIERCGKTCDLDECIEATLQSPLEKSIEDDLVDKSCYIRLEEAHKDLAQKLLRTAHLLIDEKLGRQETENKLNDCVHRLSEVEAEKLGMVQKTEAVSEELAKCRRKTEEMSEEGDRVAQMFDESKRVSLEIRAKYKEFEAQLNDYKEKYESLKERYSILISEDNRHNNELLEAKERIEELKAELVSKHVLVLGLQDEIARLQQDVASTEFERCQINMQLCDTARELELQQELSRNLDLAHKRALAAISDMKDKGILQTSECETLLLVIHGSDA